MTNVFEITVGVVINLFFDIHFIMVAKSFYLKLADPRPDEDSDAPPADWDQNMYQNRQAAHGQPQYVMADMNSGQKPVQAIPVGMPGQQNAVPMQGFYQPGLAGVQVMGQPMAQPMGQPAYPA